MLTLETLKNMKLYETVEIGPLTMEEFDDLSGYFVDNHYVVGYNDEVFQCAVAIKMGDDLVDFLEKEELDIYLKTIKESKPLVS